MKNDTAIKTCISYEQFYITTVTPHGDIWAWVSGSLFCSLVNKCTKPVLFNSYEEATAKMKTLPHNEHYKVRRVMVTVNWVD